MGYTFVMKTPVSARLSPGMEHDFSKNFMYTIHQMCFLVQKHLEQVLTKKKSLSFSQFMILVGFKCSDDGNVSQSEIAERLNLTEATVSRHISSLVEHQYLSRAEDKKNRRKHIIALTDKGKKAFDKASLIIEKELKTIFTPIHEKDRIVILKNFSTILTSLLAKK
jgi:DNA-binding MarR family transcriptional regulator